MFLLVLALIVVQTNANKVNLIQKEIKSHVCKEKITLIGYQNTGIVIDKCPTNTINCINLDSKDDTITLDPNSIDHTLIHKKEAGANSLYVEFVFSQVFCDGGNMYTLVDAIHFRSHNTCTKNDYFIPRINATHIEYPLDRVNYCYDDNYLYSYNMKDSYSNGKYVSRYSAIPKDSKFVYSSAWVRRKTIDYGEIGNNQYYVFATEPFVIKFPNDNIIEYTTDLSAVVDDFVQINTMTGDYIIYKNEKRLVEPDKDRDGNINFVIAEPKFTDLSSLVGQGSVVSDIGSTLNNIIKDKLTKLWDNHKVIIIPVCILLVLMLILMVYNILSPFISMISICFRTLKKASTCNKHSKAVK